MAIKATEVKAELREKTGKGAARALRREGKVPAIIYGGKEKEIMISLESKQLAKEYHRPGFYSRILNLKAGNDSILALPKEIELDVVTDKPIHADFLRVIEGEKVKVWVKVKFLNTEKSPGIKRGGVLNIVRHEIEFLCDLDKIPESIDIDLAKMSIGDSAHISHVQLPEGVEPIISDRDFTIATIAGRMKEEAAATAKPDAETAEESAEGEEAKAEGEEKKEEGKAEGKKEK